MRKATLREQLARQELLLNRLEEKLGQILEAQPKKKYKLKLFDPSNPPKPVKITRDMTVPAYPNFLRSSTFWG